MWYTPHGRGQFIVPTGVLIYQSMSGDASEGESYFSMTNGSFKNETGCVFHVTNTTTSIDLTNVNFESTDDNFIILSADTWGNQGSNGGHATLTLNEQEIKGNAVVNEYSSLNLILENGSTYTGAVNMENSDAEINITIKDGTWTLTGDSYISSFDGDVTSIQTDGYHLYVDGQEIA